MIITNLLFEYSFYLPVLIGAIFILFSAYKDWLFLYYCKGKSFYKFFVLRIVFLLVYIFLYLAIILYGPTIFGDHPFLLSVFLLGNGLVLFFESYINNKTYKFTEGANVALANANVNMALLYTQLEVMKTNLEDQTHKLSQAYEELKETQDHLIQREKMASLGQLVAGIGHELNTPMGSINASSDNIQDILNNHIIKLVRSLNLLDEKNLNFAIELIKHSLEYKGASTSIRDRKKRKEIEGFLEDQKIENADVKADMFVDMHITENIEHFLPLFTNPECENILQCAYTLASLNENNRSIKLAAQKAKKIVFSLKLFSHYDQTEEAKPFEIKKNIETILVLYSNQIKQGIELITNFENMPDLQIIGFEDELGQVWTNLVQNALQAMNHQGRLKIELKEDADSVYVNITDSGVGISQKISEKIFQPFFTTKNAGEGSGLGLHITKKIVEEKHKGKVFFTSVPGETTFSIKLPKTNKEI